MNHGLWIARKNYLFTLVKQLSERYGGDETEFLKQHHQDILDSHPQELIEDAIVCYQGLLKQLDDYRS